MAHPDRCLQETFARAKRFVTARACDESQKELLLAALVNLESQRQDPENLPFILLPRLVFAAIRGREEPSLPLCMATTLLFTGIDLLDDLADGDLPASWRGRRPQELQLAAATFLASLPQLALAEIEAPPPVLTRMQKALAQGLLRMSAGQQKDLAMAGKSEVLSCEVEASVEGKSGEELALFALLAATLAQAPEPVASAYESLGRAMGTAGQLASDCKDIFQDEPSRDLANGTRTFPIARHLERLPAKERERFARLLDRARSEPAAARAVREELVNAGELRLCAFMIETYCQKAFSLLEEAWPLEPAAGRLHAMIARLSFFPQRRPQGQAEIPVLGGTR